MPPHTQGLVTGGGHKAPVLQEIHVCISRWLFCLFTGITAAASTVKVDGETLHIHLQSPVPDGAVTDFGEALQTRGNLTREPQGVIRTFEVSQLHIVFGWHVLLRQLTELTKWCVKYHAKTVQLLEIAEQLTYTLEPF